MKIVLFVVVVVIILATGLIVWIGSPKGPRLEDVAHRTEPLLTSLPAQKVLLVKATGDPNVVGKGAFGLLMRTYMRMKDVPKGGPEFQSPRARWPVGEGVPPDQWEGHYAMPVPDSVSELPSVRPEAGMTVELATWEYGEVAEILHVGPYDAEGPTIERLKAFIADQGYEIAGLHEEEYLKGPGWLFRGNPDTYLTIIRYPVRRISGAA